MSDDLKPCPFCGGEASKTPDPSHSTGWEVGCFSRKCDVEPHVWAVHLETAVMQWNTRADAATIKAAVEMMATEHGWVRRECLEKAVNRIEELEREVQEAEERESIAADAAVKYLERIEKLEAACWRMQQERDRAIGWRDRDQTRAETAEAKLNKAVEALTPSGATKAAYMGEIKDPETKRIVSWTAIKMVMQMISNRAVLAELEGK